MTRRLLIVGAGDFARELASWLRGALPGDCTFGGFLDDDLHALDRYPMYQPAILATVEGFAPGERDVFAIGIAEPAHKLRIAGRLSDLGAEFLTFVHATATVADYVSLGRGAIVCPHAVISCHAALGDFVTVNLGATIGHDTRIGRGCTLSAHADVTGFATLDEGVFLGSHASILPKAHVGAYARVGAGSVVLKTVKPGATVMGVPAKQISA